MLRDPRFSADDRNRPDFHKQQAEAVKRGIMSADEVDDRGSMLRIDPPDHTRLRGLVSKAFTPRTVETLRPRIEAIVEEHARRRRGRQGSMDVIGDLAYPLPVIVIAEMLGHPHRGPRAVQALVRRGDPSASACQQRGRRAPREQAAARVARVLRSRSSRSGAASRARTCSARSSRPRSEATSSRLDEVFSTMHPAARRGQRDDDEPHRQRPARAAAQPEQFHAAAATTRRCIEHAVEELLRYDSPVQATVRFTLEDRLETTGTSVPGGQQVIADPRRGNRDPAQFATRSGSTSRDRRTATWRSARHPLLPGRAARPARGRDRAPGADQRFPDMRLAVAEPKRGDNILLRGLAALPVTF